MQKAIGLITCASVMAVSLYLFSGGDPSRTLAARTESDHGDGDGAVARQYLQEAREQAQQGRFAEARRLAGKAASMNVSWGTAEQSPSDFLDGLAAAEDAPADFADVSESSEPNPFAEEATEPAAEASEPETSGELLKKKQAQRLVREARAALQAGDTALARSRALQARQLKAPWGLWDDRPEHVLADLDARTGTSTFVAGGSQQTPAPEIRSKDAEANYQQAASLLQQARVAMDAGQLTEAQQLAEQAATCNAAYGMFEDSPERVLRDIARLQGTSNSANETFAATASDSSPDATRARKLLREARAAILEGRLGVARAKAEEAGNLNVAYNVLDDRPELVLNDIAAALRGQKVAQSTAESADFTAPSASTGARDLVAQARAALDAGDHQTAEQLAYQAQQQDAAYGVLEDRPEVILEEARLMAQRDPSRNRNSAIAASAVDMTPAGASAGRVSGGDSVAAAEFDGSEFGVVSTAGASGPEAYRRGIELLRSGDRNGAKAAFQQALNSAGELTSMERRQLHDFMQSLASTPARTVQLASQQESADGAELPGLVVDETDALTAAVQQSDVQYDRLRTEVMNSVFRAEKLKNDNPDEALQILDNALATVEAAPLNKESLETLAGYVRRSHDSISAFKEQQAPRFELEAKNDRVLETIKREEEAKIRIEQEFAELVEQFNQKIKERSYAEAELIAKKARDLNPDLPQAEIMIQKARFEKQIAFNEETRDRKADSFTEQLNDVELAAIKGADYELPDARSWEGLTKRRERFGRTDERERSESVLQIEKSLSQKVSLHFHDVPLAEVIRHIANVHGINVAIKAAAIESDGLTAMQPVTIDVDGITLQSALNLLLEQAGGLVYSIQNETLMITNRLEQESVFVLAAYNVADLVVPMGAETVGNPINAFGTAAGSSPTGLSGNGQFQVDDQLAVNINGNGRPSGQSGSASSGDPDFSGLIDLITTTVEPGSWDLDGGDGTIGVEENTLSLVIRQTAAVHEQIADLLKQLRKLQDLQVTVEVRFISVSDSFFERIGVDFDFNVQDTLGDPPGVPAFGSRQLTFPGAGGGGGGAGGGGQAGQGGDLRGNQQGQGQGGGQQGQQAQQGVGQRLFDPVNRVNSPRDDFSRTTVGLAGPNQFTEDYDIQFRQGSFEIGVPDFGNFQPNAGIQVGMAILSDIEAFFFIQAAQGDQRSNLLFAPKVTMYNGLSATVSDFTQRYLVVGQIPNLAPGAVGFQPIIQAFPDGIFMTVTGVVSADRRYVRLSVSPNFTQIIDVQTFTNVNAGGAGIGGAGGVGGGGIGGGGIGGGGGGGGQFGFGGIGGGFGGGGGGGGFGGGGGGGQQGQQGQQGGQNVAGTVQLPIISTFNVGTVVSVPDGGTILLGGIKRLREGRNMAGVPILNKIPYISRLFKNSGVGRETESIMLMVTPRIIIQEEEEELIIGTAAEG